MSMPNIPDINPKIDIDLKDSINLLLASIALEELGLAHIINAEGEKIQCFTDDKCDKHDLICIDKVVNDTLKNVIKTQMLLQFKLEEVIDLIPKCK